MKMNEKCIMPEMPYCPCCRYGLIIYPEDTNNIYDSDPEWVCMLESEEKEKDDSSRAY